MQTRRQGQHAHIVSAALVLILTSVFLGIAPATAAGPGQHLEAGPPSPDGQRNIRKRKVEEVYHNLLSSRPQEIIQGTRSVEHLFAGNVRGRVAPMGQFPGFEAALEYFYGFATTPGLSVTGVTFKSLAAEKNLVAVEVDIAFDATGTLVGREYILTHTGFFTFDKQDRIVSFDLTLPNLGAAVNPRSRVEKNLRLLGVCALLTLGGLESAPPSCPGEFDGEQSGEKFLDCVRFMLSLPYGSYDRANSNTFVCRELHSLLTPLRPDIHCPHTGKSGGMTCIDFPYETYYETDF